VPVANEHVDKIIDLRRYLVLTEGKMDGDAQRAIQNIERQGNPWGLNRKERETWRELQEDVHIPTVKELKKQGEQFDYLFWVSSMGSFDNRSQKIALSFAKLLNEAGVRFAILGNKEKNSGVTPRRLGNEFLFQELATHDRGCLETQRILTFWNSLFFIFLAETNFLIFENIHSSYKLKLLLYMRNDPTDKSSHFQIIVVVPVFAIQLEWFFQKLF
jgi:hypothetical protein